jgi:N-acetylglutamate synthase-like GNAT family acetyltransferase
LRARRARFSDAEAIHALIADYAAEGVLLPRTLENVREQIPSFLVVEEKRQITGCVCLENYSGGLAEIRSLAVRREIRGKGLGGKLVAFALSEARNKGIARVFAVTHAPEFFIHHGFAASSRRAIPEKIERDCCTCPKAKGCRLTAVIATVIPESIVLPVLDGIASSSLA